MTKQLRDKLTRLALGGDQAAAALIADVRMKPAPAVTVHNIDLKTTFGQIFYEEIMEARKPSWKRERQPEPLQHEIEDRRLFEDGDWIRPEAREDVDRAAAEEDFELPIDTGKSPGPMPAGMGV